MSKHSQDAGDNSKQLQVFGDVNIMGVTEDRARAIAKEEARSAISGFSQESAQIAKQRTDQFDDLLIEKLAQFDRLRAFANPAFHVPLLKAHISAASSGEPSDYELLVQLLAERAADRSRRANASIDHALEIVGTLDAEALRCITLYQACSTLTAGNAAIDDALDLMDEIFAKIIDEPLPSSEEWSDHLDVQGLVRRVPFGQTFLPFLTIWSNLYPCQLAAGVPLEKMASLAGEALAIGGIGFGFLQQDLATGPDLYRLAAANKAGVISGYEAAGIAKEKIAAIVDIYEANQLLVANPEYLSAYDARLGERPHIAAAKDWWGSLTQPFLVTAVGRVVVNANLMRIDNRINVSLSG